MLVVEDEVGKVCGYCDIDGREGALNSGLPPRPYLSDLAVCSKMQRQGVATKLVESCEEICRSWGHSYLYLKVDKGNRAAFELYEKLGYTMLQPDFDEKNQMLLGKPLAKNTVSTEKIANEAEVLTAPYSE